MVLQVPLPDPDRLRQTAWRQRNVARIKANRAYRLQQLDRDRDAISRAARAYRLLDRGTLTAVVLRGRFIRLDTPRRPTVDEQIEEPGHLSPEELAREREREIRTRPPLTQLVHRQSSALSVYLTAIYVAHLELQAGNAYVNNRRNSRTEGDRASWIWVTGMHSSSDVRVRRARMRRALDELDAASLVSIRPPGARSRYEGWKPLRDDGTGSPYVVPSERRPGAVDLSPGFFLNGWHLVLTSGEIAMLLAITHMHRLMGGSNDPRDETWVALPQSVRRNSYGLTGEIYLHAQQLHEFGLIEFHDPMPNRKRGKISPRQVTPIPAPATDENGLAQRQEPPEPVPYQFRPANPMVFNQNAFTVVHDTLTELSLPYRLDDNGILIPPQSLVKSYREAKRYDQRR